MASERSPFHVEREVMKGRLSPAIGECGGAVYPYTQIVRLAGAFVNAPSRFGGVDTRSVDLAPPARLPGGIRVRGRRGSPPPGVYSSGSIR
jgi:hypothetical protein